MEIVTTSELKKVKRDFSFYDFKNHEAINGQILIKFNDELKVTRFDDIKYGGLPENFEIQAKILKDLMMEIIDYYNSKSVLLVKYQPRWIVNNTKSPELAKQFRYNGLRTNFSGSLNVNDIKMVEDFFYSNIKYNSFTHFILLEPKVILTPTDHLDIFVASSNFNNTFDNVKKISDKYKSSKIVVKSLNCYN